MATARLASEASFGVHRLVERPPVRAPAQGAIAWPKAAVRFADFKKTVEPLVARTCQPATAVSISRPVQ